MLNTAHYGKILISIFKQFIASIDTIFRLKGRMDNSL